MNRCLLVLSCLVPAFCLAAQARQGTGTLPTTPPPAIVHKVDALFAPWSRPGSPGCALAIIQHGKVIYRRGYGMADLEDRVRISPATVFHVASMSKQFTAFAIHLLAADGKLSLDDDIRKYLPELNDFGTRITIRHLLHHTSGLRDQWSLLALAGWRLEDVITEDDILRLLWRQRSLNFMPGDEELYSNTGYTLLGVIVKRVSGKSLAAFTQERIFGPLGMRHTHFHDDYGVLVPGRAYSYDKQDDGSYRYIALSYSNAGATSLFTTVEDLALWDQNFYDARVGGKDVLAQMQQATVLNGGMEIDYASGLVVSRYRGLPTVEHSGGDAGYRSDLIRFPEQHFSVVALCNAGDANPSLLTQEVADIFLSKLLKPRAPGSAPPPTRPSKPKPIQIDPASLDALVGEFELSPGFSIVYTKENDRLMAQATRQGKLALVPTGERTFTFEQLDASVTFDKPGPDGIVAAAVHHQGGRDFPLKRIKRVPLSAQELKDREGEFYSDELHVLYTIIEKNGGLVLLHPRAELPLQRGADASTFFADFPIGMLRFSCVAGQACDGFSVTDGRVRNLRFIRAQQAYATVAVEPARLDRYAGHYQLTSSALATVTREGDHLLAQLTERPRYELFPASDHDYFASATDLHADFTSNAQGEVTGIELHVDGTQLPGKRIDEAAVRSVQGYLQRRLAENVPLPGSEAALRQLIKELRGDADAVSLPVTPTIRQRLPTLHMQLAPLGEVRSIEYTGVGERGGADVYAVQFAGGEEEWRIGLGADRTIEILLHRPFKRAPRLPTEHADALRSGTGSERAAIEFLNRTANDLQVYWIDPDGELRGYGSVAAAHMKTIETFVSYLWLLGTDRQHPVAIFTAAPGLTIATVD